MEIIIFDHKFTDQFSWRQIDNDSELVLIVPLRWTGDRSLLEPMVALFMNDVWHILASMG